MKNQRNNKINSSLSQGLRLSLVIIATLTFAKTVSANDQIYPTVREQEVYQRADPVEPNYTLIGTPEDIDRGGNTQPVKPSEELPTPLQPRRPCCQNNPQDPQTPVTPTQENPAQDPIAQPRVDEPASSIQGDSVERITDAMSGGGCTLGQAFGKHSTGLDALLLTLPFALFLRRKKGNAA